MLTAMSVFQLKPTSIEKKIFPEMCNAGELFAMELPGLITLSQG